jgi:hypothetical protein
MLLRAPFLFGARGVDAIELAGIAFPQITFRALTLFRQRDPAELGPDGEARHLHRLAYAQPQGLGQFDRIVDR